MRRTRPTTPPLRCGLAVLLLALSCGGASVARADAPPEPAANFAMPDPPESCQPDGQSADCVSAGVQALDQARAALDQPVYALPGDFVGMEPDQQVLVLADLDRSVYGLAPIGGVTASLDQDAAAGVRDDADPTPSDPAPAFASNWAGGAPNVVFAYLQWMYDDGPGSGNVDCTAAGDDGCWGHRDNVLADFGDRPASLGVATGNDSAGRPGAAMLITTSPSAATPTYTYTWTQALADGAGPAPVAAAQAAPSVQAPAVASVRVRKRTVTVRLRSRPPSAARCVLARDTVAGRRRATAHRCVQRMVFARLTPGRYVFAIRTATGGATRRLTVR